MSLMAVAHLSLMAITQFSPPAVTYTLLSTCKNAMSHEQEDNSLNTGQNNGSN